ncbi:AAA family ATPase [Plantactinospora sp. KBS50]|uniref:AAA family ATPase n=1 Tax=Plantactinospora sp. KBS50 TaxID=2024580 RepID=UPI000BAB0B9F|nr:AAA family ATPase [Plantactinospora sp. KBS50]ASW55776.1 hypothetical protein CIK06_18735 [Plantactinospora sp. KBS50]
MKRPPAPRPAPTAHPQPPLSETITAGAATAEAELGADSLPAPQPVAATPGPGDLVDLWQQATRVRQAYQDALAGIERRTRELDARAAEIERGAAALAVGRGDLDAEEARLASAREELAARASAIDARDRDLLDREMAFAARQDREKEEIVASARAELSAARDRFEATRHEFDEELARQRVRIREELAAERDSLDTDRATLAEERHRLRRWDNELRIREEDLQDAKEMYEERTTLSVAAATEEVRLQSDHLRRLYGAARSDADRQSERLAEYERLRRALEDRDPQEVREELDRLRAESEELRRLRLTAAPAETDLRLAAVEEEARRLRERCATYAAENERLQRQLSAHEITATSLERLAVVKEALEAENRAYRDIVEDQKRDWHELVERREGASPLPTCTDMDSRYPVAPADLGDAVPALPDLVRRVRALIRQQHGLFYEEADLRSFLGGLATSQLHLLQGISGIGKTQLPQRFAEAIGATSAVVSVGADWRTPQDLMGYYNAFERRFYESEFTKALYQAQCPQFAAQPFFIVLDEMNLSHPEQYFNDVLSALERRASRDATPDLVLMSAGVTPAPRLLREGRLLPVPRSVFFVGTANHDETTVSFADKTYDRAHVVELPASPQPFDVDPQDPLPRLSFAALSQAFDAAAAARRASADRTRQFLATVLAERMATDFRVSWGSRLYQHVDRYVPVVLAAGGSLTEATDHLVATKILRKLRGRYEIRVDQLRRLRDELAASWPKLGDEACDGQPRRSLAALDDLVRDLGHQ